MDEFADLIFDTSAPALPPYERRQPRRPLLFSMGAPMAHSLSKSGHEFLRLTVKTRLISQPQPNTHYWASGDMAWWFWAARVVLNNLHGVLTSPQSIAKSHIYALSMCGPWRCGSWRSDATWLSRFIHVSYSAIQGSFLYPYVRWVDKHLMNRRDFLRFDIFLLQCWSQMDLNPEQKATVDTISFINEQPPEVCLYVLDSYMERTAPDPRRPPPQAPATNGRSTAYPRADLDSWYEVHPDHADYQRDMFWEYARHLARELLLDLEAAQVLNTTSSPGLALTRSLRAPCVWAIIGERCNYMQTRLDSYIDCVLVFKQRLWEMERAASPVKPTNEVDTDLGCHGHQDDLGAC
ncbi:hypothetical protein DHEL01_v212525 [Diaporthe helianthi]|uniref:Uncharacterized protein n=1 Tax=Diaporthe helianthi TaxID=158607 RepID=A0A2P5HFR7_DIAHE|nr:hypothetical protein DHEL01_v212525 [Diaporthe helianthi]